MSNGHFKLWPLWVIAAVIGTAFVAMALIPVIFNPNYFMSKSVDRVQAPEEPTTNLYSTLTEFGLQPSNEAGAREFSVDELDQEEFDKLVEKIKIECRNYKMVELVPGSQYRFDLYNEFDAVIHSIEVGRSVPIEDLTHTIVKV